MASALGCCAGNPDKRYLPKGEETVETSSNLMDFKHVPEPQLSELSNYMRQRREHVVIYLTNDDIRNEITRNISDQIQAVDQYPKGRQFLQDDDYLSILRDLLNISNILDDMELTGWVPYQNRTAYYACYSKLYRMLQAKAKGKT